MTAQASRYLDLEPTPSSEEFRLRGMNLLLSPTAGYVASPDPHVDYTAIAHRLIAKGRPTAFVAELQDLRIAAESERSAIEDARQVALRVFTDLDEWTETKQVAKQAASLIEFLSLPDGWDGSDAPPPNIAAAEAAHSVLRHLVSVGLESPRITPSVEGGIGISYEAGSKYAFIEAGNDGEVIAALSTDAGEEVWTCEQTPFKLRIMALRLAAFLMS